MKPIAKKKSFFDFFLVLQGVIGYFFYVSRGGSIDKKIVLHFIALFSI